MKNAKPDPINSYCSMVNDPPFALLVVFELLESPVLFKLSVPFVPFVRIIRSDLFDFLTFRISLRIDQDPA